MTELILKIASLAGHKRRYDLYIAAGFIAALEVTGRERVSGLDLAGKVVLPGLVEAHTHLDKTFSSIENQSRTLREAMDMWRRIKTSRTLYEVQEAVERALALASQHGVTALRSHIDLVNVGDLALHEMLVSLGKIYRDQIDLQWVALGNPGGGPQTLKLMRTALKMGVGYIGGAPALTENPQTSIDAALDLAVARSVGVDLHIDETEDPQTLTLEYLAEQTIARGLQGQVTAGHCCSLGFVDDQTRARVIEKVAAAEINIITLPSCNLVLMGRSQRPVPRGITPVQDLLAAGVNVCAASDNVRDPFNPFGSYDPLQIANLNAHTAHMSGLDGLAESLEMVTARAARTLGLRNYGMAVGGAADLVVLETTEPLDAVLTVPRRHAVMKAGQFLHDRGAELQRAAAARPD